jgi:hypothetical protein
VVQCDILFPGNAGIATIKAQPWGSGRRHPHDAHRPDDLQAESDQADCHGTSMTIPRLLWWVPSMIPQLTCPGLMF